MTYSGTLVETYLNVHAATATQSPSKLGHHESFKPAMTDCKSAES
jgi:hypothetical protein